jgi:hypothetical protein
LPELGMGRSSGREQDSADQRQHHSDRQKSPRFRQCVVLWAREMHPVRLSKTMHPRERDTRL